MPGAAPLAPVPVTVVTGFLGAGKTTLLNRWLAGAPPGDLAVLVNELGAVGVDGALLEARAGTLIEIAGGCVCCTTQAELVRALDGLATAPAPPGRILVETSGAASPAGVLRAISGSARRGAHALDGIVTVVDASRPGILDEHDLAVEQVGYADIVVLSRAELCDGPGLARARDLVATYNAAACVVPASRGAPIGDALATLDAVLARRGDPSAPSPLGPEHPSPLSAAPRRASHAYESFSLVLEGEVDGERFAEFMEAELGRFAGRLFRTKGIIAVRGLAERLVVQGVADLVEVTLGAPWGDGPRSSRLVVVGFGLSREPLARAFRACAAAGPSAARPQGSSTT